MKKVTASGDVPINSVAISPKYAESVIMTDPSKVNIFTSKAFTEDNFVNFGSGKFSLTATQGAAIRLPNGTTVSKAFRGLAESSAERLDLAVRSGVFAGESLDQITRRLVGRLEFADFGPLSVKQLALAGGELTKVANNQISTIVRTSVNQVTNQASQAVYAANKKVAPKYEYVATLDSRTSPICQRLDGQIFDYNKGPTPPQHFNCRSTTVPVVDFDGLQKKYPTLEKPPATKLDTRPSITGRVPQGTPYGNWLLQQDRKLQVKTLGNKGKVNFFKKLAKKEGSGQAALRKMIRTDGSERSLKDLERLYGKPSAIKPKVKPEVATSQIKTSPVMGTNGVDKYLVENNIAKTSQEFIEDSLDSLEKLGGLTKTNVKKMRKFMKKTKLINHFNMKGEKTDLKQIKEKFLTGNNLKAFKEQLKATEKRFAIQQAKPKMSKEFKEWTSPLLGGIRTQFQILNEGKGIAFDRYMVSQHFKNAGGLNLGFTNTNYSIVHTQLTTQSKKINLNLAKKMKASATKTLDNNALLHNRGYDFARQNNLKEIWAQKKLLHNLCLMICSGSQHLSMKQDIKYIFNLVQTH